MKAKVLMLLLGLLKEIACSNRGRVADIACTHTHDAYRHGDARRKPECEQDLYSDSWFGNIQQMLDKETKEARRKSFRYA